MGSRDIDSLKADTPTLATADYSLPKGSLDRHFRVRRIVSQAHNRRCGHKSCIALQVHATQSYVLADDYCSVCIISIIRLVVLSRLADVDVTCTYSNSLYATVPL